MKKIVLAAALVAAGTGFAVASDADYIVAQTGGEAMAFAELCPLLRFDSEAMARFGVKNGVFDFTVLSQRDIRSAYERAMGAWKDRRSVEACDAGRHLFGPKGAMAVGVLVDR